MTGAKVEELFGGRELVLFLFNINDMTKQYIGIDRFGSGVSVLKVSLNPLPTLLM
jgi:hypothetical protein